MQPENYPASFQDLKSWQTRFRTTAEEARRRFVQFVVLVSVSSSTELSVQIAFKGGNALRFVHGNRRSTLDLDFSAELDFPDSATVIKDMMDRALRRSEGRYQVKARCQRIKRNPPGLDKTLPTYALRVAYQIPGDRYYRDFHERIDAGRSFSELIDVEISLNDSPCETTAELIASAGTTLRVSSLNDIVAEKLRALLQQVPRKRQRPQDAFDIASMLRKHDAVIDRARVSDYLSRKSLARDIVATKSSFADPEIQERASGSYDSEIRDRTDEFIPFEEAWAAVLLLVSQLDIPD